MARIVRIHEYGDPSVLKIEDIEVPPPANGEVQIEVKSIGLNRAEVMFRTHAYIREAHFPSRLGYEAAGIVKAIAAGVSGFTTGDVVSLVPPPDIARWALIYKRQLELIQNWKEPVSYPDMMTLAVPAGALLRWQHTC